MIGGNRHDAVAAEGEQVQEEMPENDMAAVRAIAIIL